MIKVAASGYFNPLHTGHIEYLEKAKELGDYLIVIVNNDKQRALKGSKKFMNENERIKIVKSLKVVDDVFLSIDEDLTICNSLKIIKPNIFANGGDRLVSNPQEEMVCKELKIDMINGLGEKIQSSSYLLNNI